MENWLTNNWIPTHPGYDIENAYLHNAGGQKIESNRVNFLMTGCNNCPKPAHIMNMGDPGFIAFKTQRVLGLIGKTISGYNAQGIFWDVTASGTLNDKVPNVTLEYPSRTAYLTDLKAFLQSLRPQMPAGRTIINSDIHTTQLDAEITDAAGGLFLEFGNTAYGETGHNLWPWVDARLAAGTKVGWSPRPIAQQKDLVNGGLIMNAGNYSNRVDRILMGEYAAYLMTYDPAKPDLLVIDFYGTPNSVYPSYVWRTAFEKDIGPATAKRYVLASGMDGTGQSYKIYARDFTKAFVLYRPHILWSHKNFDDNTAITVNLPSGTWYMLQPDGNQTGPYTSIQLRNSEAAIFMKSGGGTTPPPPGAPTLYLFASPTSITSGGSSTLSWSSTNASSCSAGGAWTGSKSTSGSQTVTPTVTSTYSLTCTGSNGSASGSAMVTVTTPTTAKFKAGDRVQTTATTEVRQQQYLDGTVLGSQPTGALGTVVGGPFVRADGTSAWNIDFDNAPDGWVKESYLVLSSATPPPPTSWDYSLSGNPSITITKSSNSDVTASYTLTKTLTAGTPTPYIYTTAIPSPSGSGIIVGYSIRDCAPSATIGSSCQSSIIFTVPPTASAQTYTVLTTNQPKTSSWVDAPPYKEFSFNLVVNSSTVSAPTLSLFASPTSITSGGSSTLSWSSTNTSSCSAGGAWTGSKSTSGSQVVTPTVTSTYSLTCTGSGGSASQSTTVTVTTTPPPTTAKFKAGDRVQTTDNLNVRASAGADSLLLGTQPTGSLGTVVTGPTVTPLYTWWNVDFDNAPDGWVIENYLVLSSATPPPPPPGVPSVTISAYPTSINTGQSSTLSWSSVNTTSCSASGSWNGDRPLSGTQVVTPTITSNYIITCLGGGTSTGDLVTVTVTSTPTPPPPSSGISIGDWIQVTEKVSVRYLPATDSKRLGVQYVGTKGKVIGGPAQGSGYTWWNIDYTVVPDGWSVENYITETTAPTSMAVGSRVTTTDNIKVRSAPNGERIGRQPAGSQGTITAGPIQSGGYTWWNVNFDSGTDGWAAGSYLAGQ